MDLGGWTVDLMHIDNAIPAADTAHSLELGMIRCVDDIREQAVSYTHLDVYKRQVVYRDLVFFELPGEVLHLRKPLFQQGEGFLFLLSGIERGDVYKRQHWYWFQVLTMRSSFSSLLLTE